MEIEISQEWQISVKEKRMDWHPKNISSENLINLLSVDIK